MKKQHTYHIIGGGISGMSFAFYLRKKHRNAEINIYEASSKLGGKCFCFEDKKLRTKLDNGTHVILKSNRNTIKLIKSIKSFNKLKENTLHKYSFYNVINNRFWQSRLNMFSLLSLKVKLKDLISPICQSLMNTELVDVNKYMFNKTIKRIFPLNFNDMNSYVSSNQLDEIITIPLEKKLKEMNINIHLNSKINNVDIFPNDEKVIFATPHEHVNKILKEKIFDYNYSEIININFLTSTPITLPKNIRFLFIGSGISHWFFVNDNILAVTISCANKHKKLSDDELARKVWKEICKVRGREASFIPQYRVLRTKKATIANDYKKSKKITNKININNREFFVIGDWTSNEFPSSIETSIMMAKKLVKNI